MAPLLTDKAIILYDILVFQELQQNLYKNTIYCPNSLVFYTVYNNQEKQSYFLINKNLDINSQEIDYLGPNIYSLRLQLPDIILQIHNFYNQPPGNYSTTSFPSSLILLPGFLARKGKHLVLENFNLYHLLQSGPRNPVVYLAAESVVEALLVGNIELVTPRGMIIQEI